LSVPGESYSRNDSCALDLKSSFVLALSSQLPWWGDVANMVYILPQVTGVKLKSSLWKHYGHH